MTSPDQEPRSPESNYAYQIVCQRGHYQKTVIQKGPSEIAAHAVVLRQEIMDKTCNRSDCDASLILADEGIGRLLD